MFQSQWYAISCPILSINIYIVFLVLIWQRIQKTSNFQAWEQSFSLAFFAQSFIDSAESHPRDTEGEPLVGHWIYAWGTSIIRDKKGFQYSPLKNYRRVHKSSTNSETTCVSISFKGHYKGFQIDSTQKKSKTHVVQLRWWGVRPESHHGDWDTSRASNGFQRQQPKIQWIGLRENLQETMVFTIKYRAFL